MRKIIDGLLYDTDTAHYWGEVDNDKNPGDIYYYSEALYQKKTGEFFLYIEGIWEKSYGSFLTGGSKIIKIGYDVAKEWAEANFTKEKFHKIFGEVSE